MTAPATANSDSKVRTPGAFAVIYRLILRDLATVGRVAAVAVLGVIGMLLGLVIGLEDSFDSLFRGARFINGYGLTVMVPLISLVFASSALGDMVDDKTLVYLWLRPVNRLTVAAAAAAASLTVCLPAVVVPLVITAALTQGGPSLIAATALAASVGTVGYVGVFLALGLRFKRALVWGLVYILLWEGFVASASKTAGRMSLRAYTRSVLSEYTGVGLKLATLPLWVGIVVPLVVGALFVALTAWRLSRTPVD